MPTVLGLRGSLRAASHNATLLDVVADMLPSELDLHRFRGLGEIPPYNADLDTEPAPPAVAELRTAIRQTDGLIMPPRNTTTPSPECCTTR